MLVASCTFLGVYGLCAQESSALQKSTTLSSVETENGHAIVFRELSFGALLVTETFKTYQAPLLGPGDSGKSMVEIYRLVQPKGKVPDALVAAEDRLAALKAKPAPAQMLPPPQVTETGPGPKPYNAGEQAWFKQTYCRDDIGALSLVYCLQGWNWAHIAWNVGAHFSYYALVGSEGDTARINAYYWNGSSQVLVASAAVPPGTGYAGFIEYYQPFWAIASLDGAGANGQVSLAIKNCGNGGQWACSLNCLGTVACDAQRSNGCSIEGGHGESHCNPR